MFHKLYGLRQWKQGKIYNSIILVNSLYQLKLINIIKKPNAAKTIKMKVWWTWHITTSYYFQNALMVPSSLRSYSYCTCLSFNWVERKTNFINDFLFSMPFNERYFFNKMVAGVLDIIYSANCLLLSMYGIKEHCRSLMSIKALLPF